MKQMTRTEEFDAVSLKHNGNRSVGDAATMMLLTSTLFHSLLLSVKTSAIEWNLQHDVYRMISFCSRLLYSVT